MTWVLIIFWLGTGRAALAVPGYESEAACKTAAAVVPKWDGMGSKGADLIVCIPGPRTGG